MRAVRFRASKLFLAFAEVVRERRNSITEADFGELVRIELVMRAYARGFLGVDLPKAEGVLHFVDLLRRHEARLSIVDHNHQQLSKISDRIITLCQGAWDEDLIERTRTLMALKKPT